MALKRAKWLKYLFVDRSLAETEQNYWNEKRKKHIANEHKEGIVIGLGVTETDPPSLSIVVQGGRAINTEGNDPEVETPQEIDLTSLVPSSGAVTVYLKLSFNEVEIEPYFVDEIGDYQNKYIQDSSVLEVTTGVPVAPDLELARIELEAGAIEITNAADPQNPGVNEINLRHRKDATLFIMELKDLNDVDPDEADAFNGMNSPSAGNPIATMDDVAAEVSGVAAEVAEARGTQPSLDDRMDVMLDEDGSFKGITDIQPSAPLTGGGSAGAVPLGIENATPTSDGAMSAADKSNLDANTAHSTGDGSDHSEVAANSGHRGTTAGNPHQISHDDLTGSMPPDAHHARDHGIDSTADHNGVSGAVEDHIMMFNADGLPKDGGLAPSDIPAFDVIIDRADYASHSEAGDAFVNAIQDGTAGSIYVKDSGSDYQIDISGIDEITQARAQFIVFDPGMKVVLQPDVTYNPYFNFVYNIANISTVIFNMEVDANNSDPGLAHAIIEYGILYNCKLTSAAGNGIMGANCHNCYVTGCGNYGFKSCFNSSDCEASFNVIGYYMCDYAKGCKASSNEGVGFVGCDHISSCNSTFNGTDSGQTYRSGYRSCEHVSACFAYRNRGHGFDECEDVSGCEAMENGYESNSKDGFYDCHGVGGCKAYDNDRHGFNSCYAIGGCVAEGNGNHGINGGAGISGVRLLTNGGYGANNVTGMSGYHTSGNGTDGVGYSDYIAAGLTSGEGHTGSDSDRCSASTD